MTLLKPHPFVAGFINGFSESSQHYSAPRFVDGTLHNIFTWTITELVDRLSSRTSSIDTIYGLGQLTGISLKYSIIILTTWGVIQLW